MQVLAKFPFCGIKVDNEPVPLVETTGAVVLNESRTCLVGELRSFHDIKRHAFARRDQRYPGLVCCSKLLGVTFDFDVVLVLCC